MRNIEGQKYRLTQFEDSRIPQGYCSELVEALRRSGLSQEAEFSLLQDSSARTCGVFMKRQSPHRSDGIYLETWAIEHERLVHVKFCGFDAHFEEISNAVSFLQDVVNDRLVLLTRYVFRREDSSSLESIEAARRIMDELEQTPRGCLDYILPRRWEGIWIKSWSGKHNSNARNY